MNEPIIDLRNRPALLHAFYGRTPGSPGAATAEFFNVRMGSADPQQFAASRTVEGWLGAIFAAGISTAVVVGRDTPKVRHDNDEVAALVARDPRLVGIGSGDPDRDGLDAAIAEAGAVALRLLQTTPQPAAGSRDRLRGRRGLRQGQGAARSHAQASWPSMARTGAANPLTLARSS